MKQFLILLVSVCFSVQIFGKCKYSGIYVISSATLKKDSHFLIEFYHASQSIVGGFNQKYQVYLKSNTNKIQLVVKSILKGDFNLTQVLFEPTSLLNPGETYTLEIDKLPKYETIYVIQNGQYIESKKITWSVSNEMNSSFLTTLFPTVIKKTKVEYGCGPAEWVYFNLGNVTASGSFVKASIKHISTSKITDIIIPIENGTIKIGHGMCGGGLLFDDSNDYELRLTLEINGVINTWTKPIHFSKPLISTIAE